MDVHSGAAAGRLARVCEGTPTPLATWTMWFSVRRFRVVKKAECVCVGTSPVGDLPWLVPRRAMSPFQSKFGACTMYLHPHTSTHTWTQTQAHNPPSPRQACRWGPFADESGFLPGVGDGRDKQRPFPKISAAACRSSGVSKAYHVPIKSRIKLCCSPSFPPSHSH